MVVEGLDRVLDVAATNAHAVDRDDSAEQISELHTANFM